MSDIFIFTEDKTTINQLVDVAESIGIGFSGRVDDNANAITLRSPAGHHSEWYYYDLDCKKHAEQLPQEEVEWLRERSIVSGYCVAHPSDLHTVLSIAQKLLDEHGGFVGNDTDYFVPRFEAHELDDFKLPE